MLSQQQQTKPVAAEQRSTNPKPSTSSFKEKTKAPAPSAPKPAASAPKTHGTYYVIETGDSLDSIAKKHGVSVADLVKANRLPSANIRLARGQKIYVPGH